MAQNDVIPEGGLLDTLDTGLIVLDRGGRVVTWNAWMTSASGIDAEAARARLLGDLFPNARAGRLQRAVGDALDSGATSLISHALHPGIFPLRTRAGRELLHNISVRALGQGESTFCAIQIFDVTAATKRERVLRDRQNARYDAVVESAPDAILTLDATGLIQFANPAALREFGFTQEELVGQSADLLFGEQAEWLETWSASLRGDAQRRALQLAARRKDGSPSYVEISASRWASDGRTYITAILRDVNERHAAEQALRRLNETLEERVASALAERKRLADMVEATDALIQAVDLDYRLVAVNKAMANEIEALFGKRPKVGDYFPDLFADHPVDAAKARALWDRALGGESFTEIQWFGPEDEPRCYEIKFDILHNDRGQRVAAFQFAYDVTDRVARERQLVETQEALRQAQKMEAIGQLTGGIAHDFNNLLTGIIGGMDILKRRVSAGRYEDTTRFMDAAITSANRAAALTHRLLAFARRQPLDPKSVDVNRLVGGAEELLSRTLGERITLTTDLQDDLWPALSDPNQLESAILNLAINARDAMPDGGSLTIATYAETVETSVALDGEQIVPGEYVVVAVRDTGVGMPPEIAAKVFEPFFTTKPIGQGTGLGLSMIYGFAKQMRGHVRIESVVGRGTTVSLYLPQYRGEVLGDDLLPVEAAPSGQGETVLLIEDDSSVRLLIGEVLRELGYACIEAIDGQTALPILASNARIDLMITDVGLPGMNGRQVAEIARQHRPDLKVLFVTGYAEHATGASRFLEPGMAMVTKPFTLDALALRIRDMISPPSRAT